MSRPRWLVGVVAIVALVSCGSDDEEEPARALDSPSLPGFTVVSDANAGFAVSVPESWRQLPRDIGSFDAAAQQVPQESDKVGIALRYLKSVVRDGVSMVAIDPATGSTVNLVVLEADATAEKTASQAAIQLRGRGATDLQSEKVTVDGEPAVRQRFRYEFPTDSGGSVEEPETQYYVVRRDKTYILTLIGESPELDRIATSFQLA